MSGRSATLATSRREASGFATRVSHGLRLALVTVTLWYQRARQRRQLARLVTMSGGAFARDANFTSGDVYEEVNKPFWKP